MIVQKINTIRYSDIDPGTQAFWYIEGCEIVGHIKYINTFNEWRDH